MMGILTVTVVGGILLFGLLVILVLVFAAIGPL
jgi:hypothetical protein